MADIVITNDLLPQRELKVFEYTGHHPSRLINLIPTLMKERIGIESTDFFEDKIEWDKSGDPISFYGKWRGKIERDNYSDIWLTIIAQGHQSVSTKQGYTRIFLTGNVKTKLPVDNKIIPQLSFLNRVFSIIYYWLFYGRQIQEYVRTGREMLDKIEMEIRNMFEMIQREQI